ncbi:hypothetical protein GGS21DRAFT_546224 [Xylaria nigripes]|nr:hypothetical protein GGS21DRAFT_546224 [Xylaria nigripes]
MSGFLTPILEHGGSYSGGGPDAADDYSSGEHTEYIKVSPGLNAKCDGCKQSNSTCMQKCKTCGLTTCYQCHISGKYDDRHILSTMDLDWGHFQQDDGRVGKRSRNQVDSDSDEASGFQPEAKKSKLAETPKAFRAAQPLINSSNETPGFGSSLANNRFSMNFLSLPDDFYREAPGPKLPDSDTEMADCSMSDPVTQSSQTSQPQHHQDDATLEQSVRFGEATVINETDHSLMDIDDSDDLRSNDSDDENLPVDISDVKTPWNYQAFPGANKDAIIKLLFQGARKAIKISNEGRGLGGYVFHPPFMQEIKLQLMNIDPWVKANPVAFENQWAWIEQCDYRWAADETILLERFRSNEKGGVEMLRRGFLNVVTHMCLPESPLWCFWVEGMERALRYQC